jgi:hypothetical protein
VRRGKASQRGRIGIHPAVVVVVVVVDDEEVSEVRAPFVVVLEV